MLSRAVTAAALVALLDGMAGLGVAHASERELDFRDLRRVDSGGSYYELRKDDSGPYLHANFRPGNAAVREALVVPELERLGHHRLTWRWRALILPRGGDECVARKTDSAASVYVAWRRGLRWYGLKYSWSSDGLVGAVCDRHDDLLMRGEDIVLRTGGPLNRWATETLDLDAEFRKHLAGGDPRAEVPPLVGIAVLTDGDDTHSPASADFASFVLSRVP